MGSRQKRQRVLPGFGLAMGFTLLYLSFMVLIPLSTVLLKTATLSWPAFWEIVASPRALASYRLSLGAACLGALVNTIFGLLVGGYWCATNFQASVSSTAWWTYRLRCLLRWPASP